MWTIQSSYPFLDQCAIRVPLNSVGSCRWIELMLSHENLLYPTIVIDRRENIVDYQSLYVTLRLWEPRGYNKSIDTVSLTAICLSTTFMFRGRGYNAYTCAARRAENARWNHTFWTGFQLTEHLTLYINGLWFVVRLRRILQIQWPKHSTRCTA